MQKKVAIDLTWVRHKKVGGTESCVRNLLDGFLQVDTKGILFVLLLAKDNLKSFRKYKHCGCFEPIICNVNSADQKERMLWQNLKMEKMLRKLGIDVCLEPVYGKPYFGTKKIKFITTIHDLQAKHYPQYFSKGRVAWMKAGWNNAVKTSEKIITISEYVKQDIFATYHVPEEKVRVIYDAVVLDMDDCAGEEHLSKYGVEKGKYYYTVSSLLLHKNLKTAILAVGELRKRKSAAFYPLVISGIGGKNRDELDKLILANGLQKDIIFTPFVENRERNMLYRNCSAFVFSSIFEGFGMPPVEAMAMGVPVLTTRCTSLEEVTGGLLNYVDNPFDPAEWADHLEAGLVTPDDVSVRNWMKKFECGKIAGDYLCLIEEITGKGRQ